MNPILFRFGGVSVPSYGAMLVAGFLAALLLIRRRAPALGLDPVRMTKVAAQVTLAGVAGSRLWFVASNAGVFASQPWNVAALWQGGHVWYGAVAGGLCALAWHARRTADLRTLADLFLPAACLAHFFGRLGCFAAGCCWGRPSDVSWAVSFPAESLCRMRGIPLHPTQLYEAAGEAVIFAVLWSLWSRRPRPGLIGLTYLLLYAILRLLTEPFRGDAGHGLTMAGRELSVAQVVSVASLVFAGTALAAGAAAHRRVERAERRERAQTPYEPVE